MSSLYKRNGIYWIKHYNASKKKVERFSLKTNSYPVAKAALREFDLRKNTVPVVVSPSASVVGMYALYLSQVPIKNNSVKVKRSALVLFLNAVGEKPVSDYTKMDGIALISYLQNSGLSQTTASIYTKNIHTFFNWLLKNDLIKSNPFTTVRATPKKVEVMDSDTFEKIVKNLPLAYRVPARVALLFGLRAGELLAMEWKDIDFEKKLVYIKNEKGNRFDVIPLLPVAEEVLLPHKRQGHIIKRAYVSLNKAWAKACVNSKVKFSFHSLRKTCATNLSKTLSPYSLQKYMRHTSITITLKYYVEDNLVRLQNELSEMKVMAQFWAQSDKKDSISD